LIVIVLIVVLHLFAGLLALAHWVERREADQDTSRVADPDLIPYTPRRMEKNACRAGILTTTGALIALVANGHKVEMIRGFPRLVEAVQTQTQKESPGEVEAACVRLGRIKPTHSRRDE
jgi:hypothetical protein